MADEKDFVESIVIPVQKVDSILCELITHIIQNIDINGKKITSVGGKYKIYNANKLRKILFKAGN